MYMIIKSRFAGESDSDEESSDVDTDLVQEYANLIGPQVASRMLLYRS